jgi:hypothetical protein
MAKRLSRSETDANKTPAGANNAATSGQPSKPRRARAGDKPSAKDASSDQTRADSMASEPSEEEIRLRAYRRYVERGGSHGRHFDDWLEAEKELKTER